MPKAPMPMSAVTLSDVRACLEAQRRTLRFPQGIEGAYQAQTRRYRARAIRSLILPSVLTYNAFLLVDWLVLPETFWLSAAVHFFLVTPLILCGGWIISREPGLVLREMTSVGMPILMIGQIMFIYAMNRGEAADQYQYLALGILIYMNASQRPDMRFAAIASALVCGIYLGVLLPGASPLSVKVIGTTLMVNVAYITLTANRRMERDARYAFLTRLHERLQREEAEADAGRDALTGLANRRHFDERTVQVWSRPDEVVSPVAVVMIDVDHFKRFNDHYGHPAGDRCLKRVAGVIVAELRDEQDLAVRFGGEEFLVLLPRVEFGEAIRIAERVRRGIESLAIPHESLGPGSIVTASLGVMAGPVSSTSAAMLVAGADTALYAAKRSGRNRVWPPLAGGQDRWRADGILPTPGEGRDVG